jgi:hypothetical protein
METKRSAIPTPFEMVRMRFPVVILAMALAGTIPSTCADPNDAAGQASARGTSDQ